MSDDIIKAKSLFSQNTFPNNFNPKDWEKIKFVTNCYSYVLNLVVQDGYYKNFYYVGALSEIPEKSNYSKKEFLQILKSDLQVLGRELTDCLLADFVPEGKQKIVVFLRPKNNLQTFDFHFMKQDKDGTWSHKIGWVNLPTNKGTGNMKITNPAIEGYKNYKFIGYFMF